MSGRVSAWASLVALVAPLTASGQKDEPAKPAAEVEAPPKGFDKNTTSRCGRPTCTPSPS